MHNRWAYAFAALGFIAVNVAHSQPSPALQDARRHLLDADINVLTFHSADQLFPTSRVDASATPWVLPRAEKPLDFTYEYGGKTHAAMDILDRTYTNALVILKHGRIVAEIYRNQTDAASHFIRHFPFGSPVG